jgi:hypothetical protein
LSNSSALRSMVSAGKETMLEQQRHHAVLALEQTVAAAAHGPCGASGHCQ